MKFGVNDGVNKVKIIREKELPTTTQKRRRPRNSDVRSGKRKKLRRERVAKVSTIVFGFLIAKYLI